MEGAVSGGLLPLFVAELTRAPLSEGGAPTLREVFRRARRRYREENPVGEGEWVGRWVIEWVGDRVGECEWVGEQVSE